MTLHIIMIDWSRKFIAVKIADITKFFFLFFLLKFEEENFLFGSAFMTKREKVWEKDQKSSLSYDL